MSSSFQHLPVLRREPPITADLWGLCRTLFLSLCLLVGVVWSGSCTAPEADRSGIEPTYRHAVVDRLGESEPTRQVWPDSGP